MKDRQLSVHHPLSPKSIAIVGGDPREPARRRLEHEFGACVVHFPSRENDASSRCFAKFAHQAFDLIVWIFGRSRHAHGDFIRAAARKLGIPCLPFKSIPHPNRLRQELVDRRLLGSEGGAR
jgi:hypothetical protein